MKAPLHALHDASRRLGGHRHKGKLIGVAGPHQPGKAQRPVIPLPLLVAAVAISPVRPADGALTALHRAAHAHLFLDAPLDLRDQVPVALGAHHIGIALQPAIAVSRLCPLLRLLHQLRAIDPGRLALGRPLVVKNAALAHKQSRQLLQGLRFKPLSVPVHLIVTQPHRKGIHLLRRQLPPGQPIDLLQLLRSQPGLLPGLRRLGHAHRLRSLLLFFKFSDPPAGSSPPGPDTVPPWPPPQCPED